MSARRPREADLACARAAEPTEAPASMAGDRLDPPFLVQLLDAGPGPSPRGLLRDEKVPLPCRRDLREVRHDEDLLAAGERPELPPDGLGGRTRDARVHLVEDEGPDGAAAPGVPRPSRISSSASAAARASWTRASSPPEAIFGRGRAGSPGFGEKENVTDVDAVRPRRRRLAPRREGAVRVGLPRDPDVESGLRKREVEEVAPDRLREPRRGGGARRGKLERRLAVRLEGLRGRPSPPSSATLRGRPARRAPARSLSRKRRSPPRASPRTSASASRGRRAARRRPRGAPDRPRAARGRGTSSNATSRSVSIASESRATRAPYEESISVERLKGAPRRRRRVNSAGLVRLEGLRRRREKLSHLLDVGESSLLGGESLVLSLLGLDGVDLLHLEVEELELPAPVRRGLLEPRPIGLPRPPDL